MNWYASVPKDPLKNRQWRLKVLEVANKDSGYQDALIDACRNDLLFWINGFCWLFEPRTRIIGGKKQPTILPFITWGDQDPVLLALLEAPNVYDEMTGEVGEDVIIEKARGRGVSWMAITTILHQVMFREDMVTFGMASKSGKDADNPMNPDSLFWKIEWQLARMPKWMADPTDSTAWNRSRANNSLCNLKTNSTVVAFTAIGNLATGGRKTALLLDEFHKFPAGADADADSSTEPVTDSRWFVSTPGPRGPEGSFYRKVQNPGNARLIRMHWTGNEQCSRGLYLLKPKENKDDRLDVDWGFPEAVDPVNNPLPEGYRERFMREIRQQLQDKGYDLEEKDKLRSPWYDVRCLKLRPREVAQEYDIDYGGSASRFFSIALLEKLQAFCKEPRYRGGLIFGDDLRPTWQDNEDGKLWLWCSLSETMHTPPDRKYIVAGDVATGGGGGMSSNSTFSVGELYTGIKVAEFASPNHSPEEHARYGVALCKFFHNAKLIWEDNGPGGQFKREILSIGYSNIYFRTNTDKISQDVTSIPGWWSSTKTKRIALGHMADCYDKGTFSNPSKYALEEAKQYQEFAGGKIAHVSAAGAEDPSGAGEQHGDRVIADMLLCHLLVNKPDSQSTAEQQEKMANPPMSSFLFRRNAANEKAKSKHTPWSGSRRRFR